MDSVIRFIEAVRANNSDARALLGTFIVIFLILLLAEPSPLRKLRSPIRIGRAKRNSWFLLVVFIVVLAAIRRF